MSKKKNKNRVVVVGAGFGGLAAVRALANSEIDVVLIERENHHVFQPLLYQVATGSLSPADIASPLRDVVKDFENVQLLLDEVVDVAADNQHVTSRHHGLIDFDYLVLATGAAYSYFGRSEWAQNSSTLKSMRDALSMRERLVSAFENASRAQSPYDAAAMLTFVIVGAGPTGIEMAGAIAEMSANFRPHRSYSSEKAPVEIVLIEAGARVLPSFEANESFYALDELRALGVDVRLHTRVDNVDPWGVMANGRRIRSHNVIWCAGTRARPAGDWLGTQTASNGAVVVTKNCSIEQFPNVFAIGDVSSFHADTASPLPSLASVAKQQGHYVGTYIRDLTNGRRPKPEFEFRNWGTMAIIGRSAAVADFGWFRIRGRLAWWLWSFVHLALLADFRSRLAVYLNWTWSLLTRRRASLILTGARSGGTDFVVPNSDPATKVSS